jgi:hypothetical protein
MHRRCFLRKGFAQLGMLLANVERTCLLLTAIHVFLLDDKGTDAETFTLGYITGSKRRPDDLEYQRPGLRISGAITLAVEEASNRNTSVIAMSRERLMKFNSSNHAETIDYAKLERSARGIGIRFA